MAAPTSSGFPELFTSPAGLTTRTLWSSYLANALRNRSMVPDPAYAIIKDQNAYELFQRDTVVASAIQARKHMVAGTEWSVEPASTAPQDAKVATLCHDLIERVDNFDAARMNIAEAVFRGSAYAKILGTRQFTALSDGVPRMYWVPTRVVDIDKRRVRRQIDRTNAERPRWFIEIADAYNSARWREVKAAEKSWLIEHVYDDAEMSLGYGRGLYDALYHYLYFKTVAMTEGLQGLERWAQGWIVLEVDPERAASTGKDNDTVVDEAVATVAKHRSKHVLAHMKGDTLQAIMGGMEGHQIVMDFIRYCDDSMCRLILGSVLPSGGGDGQTGSFARAQVEQDTTEMLVHFDRKLMEGTLTKSLVALVYNLNRPLFEMSGLTNTTRPKFSLAPTAQVDVQKAVERIVSLLDHNVPLKQDEVYEQSGFTIPGPTDAIVGGQSLARQQATNPYAAVLPLLDAQTKATLGIPANAGVDPVAGAGANPRISGDGSEFDFGTTPPAQAGVTKDDVASVVREEIAKFSGERAATRPEIPSMFLDRASADAWYRENSPKLTFDEAKILHDVVVERIRR